MPRIEQARATYNSPTTRAGECPLTKHYLHKINKADDDQCDDCGETTDDIEHMLLKCQRWYLIRRDMFGLNPTLSSLIKNKPKVVIDYLRKIGRL